MEGGVVDNILDTSVGDGELLSERVVGTALLGQLEEEIGGELGSHRD